jgi:hypothetical protein
MIGYSSDAGEIANDLAHVGRIWAGAMPPGTSEPGRRGRLDAAAFSTLVVLDGDTGLGPVALHPAHRPSVDLAGDLHDAWGTRPADLDPDIRGLLDSLVGLVCIYSADPGQDVVGRFLGEVTDMLARSYTLHLVEVDEAGHHIAERPDVAGDLPAAFRDVWSGRAAA